MKKLLVFLLAMLLLPAFAMAEERVSIPLADGVLSFTPFEDGYCLTKETSASVFNRLGMSQREMFAWMDEQQVDVLMYDQDFGCEVMLSVHETDYPGYETYSPEEWTRMCTGFREHYEQYGYDVHDISVLETENFVFLTAFITLSYADGTVETRFVYETCRDGYSILMTMFVSDGNDPAAYADAAAALATSLRHELHAGTATLQAQGVTIRLTVPAEMRVDPAMTNADITPPEAAAGEIIGCMVDPAGEWFILWTLDESASGDMDRLSDAGVKALYQARAKNKKSAGCTVTLTEDHPDSRQRYFRIGYHFSTESGDIWYAEEYYTKQAGWGVSVTAYSCGEPLPEDVQTMLAAIVDSQMVDVSE